MASLKGLPSLPSLNGGSGGYFGSSSTNKGYFGGTFKPIKYKTPSTSMTAQQALMKVYLHNQQHPHHSLFGKILHDATHGVEKGLDILARPSYAVAAGTFDATKKGSFDVGQFLHGASQGIQGKDKKGFGQVLAEHHILQHHNFLRGAAGLGLDVATDPLTYATLGSSTEASVAARAAEKGLGKDVLKGAIDTAQKGTFRDARHAMDINNILAKADLPATRSLAKAHLINQQLIKKGLFDTKFAGRLASNMHGLEALSQSEIDTLGTKMVRVGYKAPFAKAVGINTKMKAPSLLRVAEGQGFLGKFPGLPKGAETVGKAFKPGWRNEKMHSLEIMSKHVAELRQDHMAHLVQQTLIPPIQELHLSEEEMKHALKVGETTPGLVTMRSGRADRTLALKKLQSMVQAGTIDDRQAQFIKAWHDTTEAMRKADAEYGVKYDAPLLKGAQENVLYVPHVREISTGLKPGYSGSLLAKKGFQYERKGGSQMALAEKIAAEHPDVQLATHPLEMIAKRAQAGANKQADQFMVDTVAKTFGVPTRLPNVAKQIELGEKYKALNGVLDNMKTLDPHALADTHAEALRLTEEERLASLAKAGEVHAQQELKLKRQVSKLKGDITKQAKNKVPSARQFMGMKNDSFSKLIKGMGRHALRAPLQQARATHKSLDALERSVTKSVHDSLDLSPVSGAVPHGSNYKRLVGELLDKAKGTLPEERLQPMRETYQLKKIMPRDSWEKRHSALVEDMLAEVKQGRQVNHDVLQKAIDKHFGGRQKLKNLKLMQTARERQLAKHQASFAQIEAKVNARAQARLTRRQMDIHDLQHRELTKATAIGKVLRKIEGQVEHHNTSVRNPEAYKPGFTVSDRLRAPNGQPYAIPTEMEQALTKMRNSLNNDEFMQKFHDTWQKLVAKWKVGVTVVNPGYRVRNTLSDLWNAYISPKGGVPLWAMARYGGKAAHMIQTVRHLPKDPATWTAEQHQASRMFTEMYHHGVLAGLFQGDIDKVRRFLEGTGSRGALLKGGHPLQALTKTATDFNRHAENWGRMMHYLYRREFQKLSAGESAKIVRGAHFDYEDLTPTEQSLKRLAIPFYTWTRKNIPYQVSQFAGSGKYAAFPLLTNEMNQASPQDPGQIVPSWIKQGLGFHVPFGGKGNFYLPVFGPTDLEKIEHPVGQGASMLSPLLQIPIELGLNKNLNTGAPIYGSDTTHPRTPISGVAASILQNFPGTNVGQTSRNVNGKKMTGPGANPLVAYLASQTPLSNLAVNAESNIKKAQRGGGQKALISEFGGVSTYKPDQAAEKAAAQAAAQKGFKQYIRGLRDQNVIPETKKRKAGPAQSANNRAAVTAFSGR